MSGKMSACVLAALRNATMAYSQILDYFDLDVLFKLSMVNTSIMIFYNGLGIPLEESKML